MGIKLGDTNTLLGLYALAYFLIIILPYLIFGFAIDLGWTSYPDVIDLVFYPVVAAILLYLIYDSMGVKNKSKFWDLLVYLAIIYHFEGHGFHWSANALDCLAEAQGAHGIVFQVAYLLDEIIGHIIMFSGLIFYFIIVSYVEYKFSTGQNTNFYFTVASGIFFSFVYTLSTIEGQYIYYFLALSLLYILGSIYVIFYRKQDPKKYVVWLFWLAVSVFAFVWAGVYYAIFGSLRQPSEILASH